MTAARSIARWLAVAGNVVAAAGCIALAAVAPTRGATVLAVAGTVFFAAAAACFAALLRLERSAAHRRVGMSPRRETPRAVDS